MSNIFGGNTGLTYDQLQSRRQMAEQLRRANSATPRTVGQGIHAIARGLVARSSDRFADREEQRMRDDFDAQFKGVAGPVQQQMAALAANPMATDQQREVIRALMAGAPAYSRGTTYHPGGEAIVGEYGPEVVKLPKGAKVKPTLHDVGKGIDYDPRGMFFQEDSRFLDDQSYQVADAGMSDATFPVLPQENDEPAPTATELAQMGERVGIDPNALGVLDLNATQARNLGYLLRMMEAENTIRELGASDTWMQRALELIPGQAIESLFMDPDYRRYLLARENFSEAALREATGATINNAEIPAQRRNYFPLPSDDEETREVLRRQREARMMALMAGIGPAAEVIPPFGDAVVPRTQQNVNELSDDELLRMLQGGVQ